MRILIVSDCTKLPGFSTLFVQPWDWACSVRDQYPNAFFDVLLPEKDKFWGDYDSSQYEDQERIRIHYVPMISTGGIQQCVIATRDFYNLFNVNRTALYYDAVLNPRAIFSPVLKKVLKPKFVKSTINIPIFNHTGSVRTNISRHNQLNADYGEEDVIAETVAWLTDFSLFMCEAERDMARDNCATYLSGKMIQRFLDGSFVSPMGGMRFDLLDKHVPKLPKEVGERGVCVFFGGRWVEGKGFSTYLDFVERAFQAGEKIYGVATTPADESVRAAELSQKYPMIEFIPNCDRETFYAKLKEGHVFFSFSMWEGFGISYWEMLYQGLVGIFLDRPWCRCVVPGYPIYCKNEKAMYTAFREVLKDFGDPDKSFYAMIENVRTWLREKYERSKVNATIYEWMLKKTQQHYDLKFGVRTAPTFRDLVSNAIERLPWPVPIEMLYRMMEAHGRSDKMEFGRKNQFISRMFLRQTAQHAGYRDICDGPTPRLVRGAAFVDELRLDSTVPQR